MFDLIKPLISVDLVKNYFVYTGKFDPPVKNDLLTYWDYEGYSAGFETGENFGCVHFKGYSDEPY